MRSYSNTLTQYNNSSLRLRFRRPDPDLNPNPNLLQENPVPLGQNMLINFVERNYYLGQEMGTLAESHSDSLTFTRLVFGHLPANPRPEVPSVIFQNSLDSAQEFLEFSERSLSNIHPLDLDHLLEQDVNLQRNYEVLQEQGLELNATFDAIEQQQVVVRQQLNNDIQNFHESGHSVRSYLNILRRWGLIFGPTFVILGLLAFFSGLLNLNPFSVFSLYRRLPSSHFFPSFSLNLTFEENRDELLTWGANIDDLAPNLPRTFSDFFTFISRFFWGQS